MKKSYCVILVIFVLLLTLARTAKSEPTAEPTARSGISVNAGWTGLPSFVKSAINKSTDSTYKAEGNTIGISYISYGSKGPNGVFSGRYSLTYSHFRSLPNKSNFTASNADMFMFDVAEILTILPSKPVNLYTGIGMGWGVVKVYHWNIPVDPTVDPEKVKDLEDKIGKYPLPFPIIYIPIGINIKVYDFIISAEAGIRDIPYLVGMLTYTFNKKDEYKIVKRFIPISSPQHNYTGNIDGVVIDKISAMPVGRAIVELPDTGMTDLSTNPQNGRFVISGLKPGSIKLIVYKEGYVASTITVSVQAGKTVSTTIELEKESTIGAISGKVTNLQGNPLSATITIAPASFSGTEPQSTRTLTCEFTTGTFFTKLQAGDYTVYASMPGYKAQTKNIHVRKGFNSIIDFVLEPELPAQPTVTIGKQRVFIEKEKKKIVITEKIFFQLGKSKILPVSFSILDELAELLVKNPDIKIRIEGYTDNIGKPITNLKLSQARAEAVMNYLIKKGVAPDRMTAKGYGMSNPIADNRTARGRAENRRVEFVITSQ
ncbi:MAG: OmpA family protein [bacterium]